MIYNHGDAIIHKENLFESFIQAIKLRFHSQQLKEKFDKVADVLGFKIEDLDRESLLFIIYNNAENNMRNMGYLLSFSDDELEHIYHKYWDVGHMLSDYELEDFVEYYYNLPKEAFQEEILEYDFNNSLLSDE